MSGLKDRRLYKDYMKQKIKNIFFLDKLIFFVYRYVKRHIGRCRLKRVKNMSPLQLVIGASGFYDSGWINTDIEYLNMLNRKHWETYFCRDSIDAILAEHVWEHLTIDEGLEAAKLCFQYLKLGGYLRAAVPDGYNPNNDYIEYVKPGGKGAGADDHKVLYSYKTFSDIFKKAGFNVVLLEWFDSKGEFHYVNWNPQEGKIYRSRRFDKRNEKGILGYTSLIIDAHKDS